MDANSFVSPRRVIRIADVDDETRNELTAVSL